MESFFMVFFSWAALVLFAPVYGLQRPESMELERNCSVRASCQTQQLTDARLFLCQCDESCVLYGDCCQDFLPTKYTTNDVPRVAEGLQCVKENRITIANPIYMVQSCPSKYSNEYIRRKCEGLPTECSPTTQGKSLENIIHESLSGSHNDTDTIASYIPVTANRSGVLYKNMFCSICHGEELFDFWQLKFMSRQPFPEDLLNNTSAMRMLLKKALKGGHRVMGFSTPGPKVSTRRCTNHIAKCTPNMTVTNNETECNGHTSYVFSRGRAYKNHQCALCNAEDEEDISCIDPNLYLNSARPRRPPPSFALLLDFNVGMGRLTESKLDHRVGYMVVLNEKEVPLPAMCGDSSEETAFYDPFTGRCVKTSCPDSFELTCGEMCTKMDISLSSNKYTMLPKFSATLGYLTLAGNILSVCGLVIQLLVYMHVSSLRNTPGKCLMCLSSCLLVSQLFFIFGVSKSDNHTICYIIAVAMHFGFLSYFFWMNVMAYDIWHAFGIQSVRNKQKRTSRRFMYYAIYCCIIPLVIVLISIALDQTDAVIRPEYASMDFCWFGDKKGLFFLFGLPLGAIMVVSIIFFILTTRNIWITTEGTSLVRKEKNNIGIYAKLALIMGLTWTVGFCATGTERIELWYIFTILNSFQGIFICFAFVCTRKVHRALVNKMVDYRRSRSLSASTKQTTVLNESDPKLNEVENMLSNKIPKSAPK